MPHGPAGVAGQRKRVVHRISVLGARQSVTVDRQSVVDDGRWVTG